MYTIVKKPFPEWQIPGFDHHDKTWSNKLVIAFDTEYQSGVTKTIDMGGKPQEVHQRRLEDIISIQLAFNYENNNPMQVFIHREPTDPVFEFNDLFKYAKKYLIDIGVHKKVTKWINDNAFYFEIWTFFGGVDLSALNQAELVLTEGLSKRSKKSKQNKKFKRVVTSNLVTMQSNIAFTNKPLNLLLRDKYKHQVDYFPKQRLIIRDMTKLAPGKSGLAALGDLIGLHKLDTEQWDLADGHQPGYYKSHMSELWEHRRDDFIDYAMTDTVITALYGSFMIGFQDNLSSQHLGNFKPSEIKPSISSIISSVIGVRNQAPADWIIKKVIGDISHFKNNKDVGSYLRDICTFKSDKDAKNALKELYKSKTANDIKDWIIINLDFDALRKGYKFPRTDSANKHHKHLVNDMTTKIDLPLNELFNDANNAYYGGYNVCHICGVLENSNIYQSCDLKSAYNLAGHTLPDIAPGLGVWKSCTKVGHDRFQEIVDEMEKLNGPYTVGCGVFDIDYPDGHTNFVITPKKIDDGPRYLRHVHNVTLTYTDAYTAWLSGAHVYTHRLNFVVQAKFNAKNMENVANEGIIQDLFQEKREQCAEGDPHGVLFKTCGNQAYGATSQGLKKKKSRDYNDGQSYFVPFSKISNPLKAAQFTAITRYHIVLMQLAIQKVDAKAQFLNCVTDGVLVMTKNKLDDEAINAEIDKLSDHRYHDAIKYHFNGQYFKNKGGTDATLANLRTRLTFSKDGALHAMVGINSYKMPPEKVFQDYIEQSAVKIPVKDHIISSLVEMRHNKKFDHIQNSWNVDKDLYLGYDFAQIPVEYISNGKYAYWQTRPYKNEDEFNSVQWFGRELIKYGPYYTTEYAPFFKQTIDEKLADYWVAESSFGSFVKNHKDNEPVKANEVYQNWLRYCLRNNLDLDASYQTIVDLFDENGWIYANSRGDDIGLPQLASFKKAKYRYANRVNKHGEELINYVLLHNVGLI
ncbi:hypothetical protein ACYATO_08770 [Lactobacillaceae bacterium Melli_B3]